jgi:CDP-diacylglycerol--glycerol-3-phosphate 3-phosphatidyltransferase
VTTSFGPSALVTPANGVTAGRLLLAIPLMAVVLDGGASWPAFVVWAVLACTDGVDGWIARRQGATRSGAFLDPLADKFLVLAALFALVIEGTFWWFPVALIAGREMLISAYRLWAGRQGITVPARPLAKVKTVVQDIAVGFALLPLTADDNSWVATTWLWAAVVLTLVSGVQYLLDAERREVGRAV